MLQAALTVRAGVSRNTISLTVTGPFNPTPKLTLIQFIALYKKFENLFYF
ncbi:transcriptional regulator [Agathobaculum sp. NSJ-28]|uniref:Transcriptional regulator n=2 Tax=Agathobaculum TaxID=2048137 RepID=A0A923LTY3_9FIRM|nr:MULTISPECIES: transcriptional regulator [Agathobaculum]MBC5723934.1 transcriptional regulator [Agathobaculum faecis]MCU6787555.1 transcriptional regulator [Agathobaculum ammoniilyticum]